jgi:hypothetical protein
MMAELARMVQTCVEGCGRIRIYKCPQGQAVPDYNHLIVEATIAQEQADAKSQADAVSITITNAAIDARLKLKGLIL